VNDRIIKENRDSRGILQVLHAQDTVPFPIRRIFSISEVPAGGIRGEHAHQRCHQFFWLISGAIKFEVNNSEGTEQIELSNLNRTLYLPPLNWAKMFDFTSDAVLLVMASDDYDPAEYITDFDSFMQLVGLQ
jgi:UDP-2-acetamido-3-amino-2,3-dideoxy-glucuronate N-acetyltransferase